MTTVEAPVQEHVFTQVSSHEQLDPRIVKGILACVPGSGMNTTDDDTLHHIQGDIVTVYTTQGNLEHVIGFSSTVFGSPNEIFGTKEYSDTTGCYFAGATVLKEHQGTGFYKQMNERRLQFALERGVDLVYTRTQNPRVQAGIQFALDSAIASGEIESYDTDRILVPGCYGHMLTVEKPVGASIEFPDLDYEAGDAYVILFSIAR